MLAPDCPVTVPGAPASRLRELARLGLTVLLADDAPDVDVPAGGAPVAVHRMTGLDASGMLAAVLGARPGEIWLLRPDAHVAAVLTDPADLPAALARVTARTPALGKDPAAPQPSHAQAGPLQQGRRADRMEFC